MESPNKPPGQTIIEFMEANYANFQKNLEEIELAKRRLGKGTALSLDNELINSETDTIEKICAYDEEIFPLLRVHTQRPVSEDDMMVLMGMIYLPKLLDVSSPAKIVYKNEHKETSDEDIFRATREVLRVHDGDTRTHSQALADILSHFEEIPDSTSHSQVVDEVWNSETFSAPAKFEVRTRKLKKGWYGGTLNQFLRTLPKGIDAETKLPLSRFVTKLTFPIDGKEHSAYRLTKRGSNIIRGIMKKVEQLHRKGVSHGNLNSHNIILDRNYSVKLGRCNHVKGKYGMQSDWKSVSKIITEILTEYLEGGAIPLDVKGLIDLLENYCRENHDIVFNHPSLWTPMERIANIIVFRSEMGASPDTEGVWSNSNCVEEEKKDWTKDICKHKVYSRALDAWIKELKKRPKRHNLPKSNEYKDLVNVGKEDRSYIGGSEILSFSRMCFNHIHQSQQQNLGNEVKEKNKKRRKKNSRQNKHRSLLQIDKELYVLFPKYMANFLEHNRTQKLITSIYKTDV